MTIMNRERPISKYYEEKKPEVSQQINTDFKDDSEEKQLAQVLYNNSW